MAKLITQPVIFEGDDCIVANLEFIAWSRYGEANPSGLVSHSHGDAYELCFMKRGTSDWWVGDNTYQIQPGEIFLTKPNEIHGGRDNTMQPCELFWTIFHLDSTHAPFAMSNELITSLDSTLRQLPCRQSKAPEFIERHFLRIFDALTQRDQYSEAVINSSMQLMLVDVIRALQSAQTPTDNQNIYSKRVKSTMEWIRNDVGNVMSVSAMAQHAGLKPSQFRDVFRTETGFSPIEYLNGQRVRRAKQLLKMSDHSVTDIALEVGFKSGQYFATCFKKITGTSPHHYRKSYQRQ